MRLRERVNEVDTEAVDMTQAITKLTTAEKTAIAIDMKKDGKSFRVIGDELGCSRQYASKLVQKELKRLTKEISKSTEELRALENTRLDYLLEKLITRIESGDVSAINAAIRLSERRSKLNGLDLAKGPLVENNLNFENNETEVVIYIPENKRD